MLEFHKHTCVGTDAVQITTGVKLTTEVVVFDTRVNKIVMSTVTEKLSANTPKLEVNPTQDSPVCSSWSNKTSKQVQELDT